MQYALLIYGDEKVMLNPEGRDDRVEAFESFQSELEARGVLRARERLRPTTSATTVRLRGGDLVIADGPFAETREQIAGFYVLECADLDEAIEMASKNPAAAFGSVEVRPIWPT